MRIGEGRIRVVDRHPPRGLRRSEKGVGWTHSSDRIAAAPDALFGLVRKETAKALVNPVLIEAYLEPSFATG